MSLSQKGLLAAIPKHVRSLILSLSVNQLSFGYVMVVVTAFLPQVGISSSLVGTIIGAEGITMVVAGIPLGILSDKKGRKWILTISAVGLSPVLFILALTTNPHLLIFSGVIAGLAEGGFLSTLNATIADETLQSGRDSAFSFSFVMSTLFSAVGFSLPFAFPVIEKIFGISSVQTHRSFLEIFGFLVIATPVALFLLLRNFREKASIERISSPDGSTRNLVKFSGANSLIGLGAGFIIPLIATWFFLKFGVPDNYSGPLLAISNITMGLSATISPRMSRRFGVVRAIVINEGLSTVFMISLAFVSGPALAAMLYVIRAALMNMSSPLSDSFLMGLVPREKRGLASAVNSVLWRIPNSFTTIVGGVILASGNYSLPIELAALFYIISIAMFYIFFRDFKIAQAS